MFSSVQSGLQPPTYISKIFILPPISEDVFFFPMMTFFLGALEFPEVFGPFCLDEISCVLEVRLAGFEGRPLFLLPLA